MLRRFLYHTMNNLPTRDQPVMHEVLHIVLNEASNYKLTAKQTQFVHLVTDCIRYGWSIFVSNGTWRLCTLPRWSNKAWKVLATRGLEVGAEVARKQLLCQLA